MVLLIAMGIIKIMLPLAAAVIEAKRKTFVVDSAEVHNDCAVRRKRLASWLVMA